MWTPTSWRIGTCCDGYEGNTSDLAVSRNVFDLVFTGETAVEGPEERRLEGEDCLQMGTHTQTRYWPHKVCTVVIFSLAQCSSTPHAQI